MQLLQLNPSIAYQVTDRLTIGFGPTIDIALASFDPAYFAPPNRIPGLPNTFLSATNARPFWGGGFRAGLVYSLTDSLDVGFGYTSEQWMETWRFNSRDFLGNPQTLGLDVSLPAIYSWGLAWRGIEGLTLGADLRYFDYANAKMFGNAPAEGGLGWESTFVAAFGANYQLTDRVAVRAGYQYNTNPLKNASALFNIQAPAIIQHVVSVGSTVNLTEAMSMSVGYAYGFQNEISGAVDRIPNANMTLSAASHSLLFNLQIKFGGGWGRKESYEGAPLAMPTATNPTQSGDVAAATAR